MLVVNGKFPDLTKASAQFKKTMPLKIANLSKNHYLLGFRKGGYQTDKSASGWEERKKADKQRGRRAILVKTGALRQDLDIRRSTFNEIVLGTNDTEYASFHNEGTARLPQREFLGESRKLNTQIIKLLLNEFKKEFSK